MAMKDQLKKVRMESGYTQQNIADFLGIERSTYAYYESGKTAPSVETLKALQRLYEVSLDCLVNSGDRGQRRSSVPAVVSVSDHNPMIRLKDEERTVIACFRLLGDKEKEKVLKFMKDIIKERQKGNSYSEFSEN